MLTAWRLTSCRGASGLLLLVPIVYPPQQCLVAGTLLNVSVWNHHWLLRTLVNTLCLPKRLTLWHICITSPWPKLSCLYQGGAHWTFCLNFLSVDGCKVLIQKEMKGLYLCMWCHWQWTPWLVTKPPSPAMYQSTLLYYSLLSIIMLMARLVGLWFVGWSEVKRRYWSRRCFIGWPVTSHFPAVSRVCSVFVIVL